MKDILVIYRGAGSRNAVDEALRIAQGNSGKAKVLQVLDSDLYFYGHNDLVAPRLNKQRFLLYIREEVLERGEVEAKEIREKAKRMGVSLEIAPVETDDLISTVLAEAGRGYEKIFMAREKRKLFPLLSKHLATQLRRKSSAEVIEC